MNKQEFLYKLQNGLVGLPQKEVGQQLCFYEEMIDDRIEEGLSEEQAVADLGTVDEILSQIASEIPLKRIVKEKIKPRRRLHVWEIIFLILGSPLWMALLLAIFAVLIAVYATLWSVVISLWAIEVSLWACTPAAIAAAVIFMCQRYLPAGIIMIAAALICAGLSVFLFMGCKAATKCTGALTVQILRAIKKSFIKKEKEI